MITMQRFLLTALQKLQTSLLASGCFWFNCTLLLLVILSYCLSLCRHLCVSSVSYPLKRVLREPSREHLIEGLSLSVVTKTTPPFCRKHLSTLLFEQCLSGCWLAIEVPPPPSRWLATAVVLLVSYEATSCCLANSYNSLLGKWLYSAFRHFVTES
jgi:hypothetical protein